jgi:hypothetical protein
MNVMKLCEQRTEGGAEGALYEGLVGGGRRRRNFVKGGAMLRKNSVL